MHVFRRLFAASAAVIVAMASGVLVAHGDSTPPVYTTPGGQISDGRLWNTTCEKYSSNVVRCSTDIWATTVDYVNGRYVQRKGWVFNNLSYLPSARSSWATNNLGRTNPNWASQGRQWRTECDTATTGSGGCRSYIWAKTVRAVKSGSGYRYVNKYAWVFNNVVLFSSPSIPAVKKVPGWIIDQSRLNFTGLGPLQLGTSMKDLETLGYVSYRKDGGCEVWDRSKSLQNRGVELFYSPDDVESVMVDVKGVRTVDGAQVGMTVGNLRAIYGNRLLLETKEGFEPVYTAVVKNGGKELVFLNGFELDRPLVDSDVIKMVIAREYRDWLVWDGC